MRRYIYAHSYSSITGISLLRDLRYQPGVNLIQYGYTDVKKSVYCIIFECSGETELYLILKYGSKIKLSEHEAK